jgi:AraC family transcriptional regulator, arabinose operon regulatory protein
MPRALIAAEPEPPLEVTPAPGDAPIVAGQQTQTRGSHRGFRPHGSKDWLLIGTTEGVGYVRAGGEAVTLVPGDLLLFAPDTPQEYGYLEDDVAWINIWVHFRARPHWIPWLVWPPRARGVMVLRAQDSFPVIEAELLRTVEAQSRLTRLHHDKALNALERVLIACDEVNPLQQSGRMDRRIRKALDIVGERLAAPLNVDALAREVGLSRSRFSVLFTEQTNLSPQTYIEFMRLTRAAQLLRMSSWSVGQIAEEVGIPNAYYFSTRFRARYGIPPTTFRAQADASNNPSHH